MRGFENIEAFVYINHYVSFNKAADDLYRFQQTVTARTSHLNVSWIAEF